MLKVRIDRVQSASERIGEEYVKLGKRRADFRQIKTEVSLLMHATLDAIAEKRAESDLEPALDRLIEQEEAFMRTPSLTLTDLALKVSVIEANDFEAGALNDLIAEDARRILDEMAQRSAPEKGAKVKLR